MIGSVLELSALPMGFFCIIDCLLVRLLELSNALLRLLKFLGIALLHMVELPLYQELQVRLERFNGASTLSQFRLGCSCSSRL